MSQDKIDILIDISKANTKSINELTSKLSANTATLESINKKSDAYGNALTLLDRSAKDSRHNLYAGQQTHRTEIALLKKVVFGNGTPGIVTQFGLLRKEVKEISKYVIERKTTHKVKFNTYKFVITVLSVLGSGGVIWKAVDLLTK